MNYGTGFDPNERRADVSKVERRRWNMPSTGLIRGSVPYDDDFDSDYIRALWGNRPRVRNMTPEQLREYRSEYNRRRKERLKGLKNV